MHLRPVLLLCAVIVLAAGEPASQYPWIPAPLDDWATLKRNAETYATTTRKQRRTLYPHLGTEWWTRIWHAVDIAKPPDGTTADDLVILDLGISTGPQSSTSCGQIVVWRGADGQAIGATIYLQMHQMPSAAPPLFADRDAWLAELGRQLAAAPPPAGAWQVDSGAKHWCATWLRAGGRVATLDDKFGAAPALTAAERALLSEAPKPLPPAKAPAALAKAEYERRADAHPQVQAALARLKAGRPAVAVAVGGITKGKPAETLGWRHDDLILSIDGTPLRRVEDLQARADRNQRSRIVLLRADGTRLEQEVPAGLLGIHPRDLAADHGLTVLALAGEQAREAAVALYALDDAPLVATAMQRLGNRLGVPVSAYLQAWQASYAWDLGRSEVLLLACTKEAKLADAVEDLRAGNRARSGRFLWHLPEFERTGDNANILRHLLTGLAADERFPLFTGSPAPAAWTEPGTDLVRAGNGNATHLLGKGAGTLAASDEALTVEVPLHDLPARCRLDCSLGLQSAELKHTGSMFQSPVQTMVTLAFGVAERGQVSIAGVGAVRLWLDGSIQITGTTLDRERWGWGQDWHTIPGRVVVDGSPANQVTMIRMQQLQRIDINGRPVLCGFLPLSTGVQTPALEIEAQAVTAPIKDFRVQAPKLPGPPSNF